MTHTGPKRQILQTSLFMKSIIRYLTAYISANLGVVLTCSLFHTFPDPDSIYQKCLSQQCSRLSMIILFDHLLNLILPLMTAYCSSHDCSHDLILLYGLPLREDLHPAIHVCVLESICQLQMTKKCWPCRLCFELDIYTSPIWTYKNFDNTATCFYFKWQKLHANPGDHLTKMQTCNEFVATRQTSK